MRPAAYAAVPTRTCHWAILGPPSHATFQGDLMSIPQTPSIPAYSAADRQYREDLIRERAYARSQLRRPCIEQETLDWLAAEAEVDALLTFHPRHT